MFPFNNVTEADAVPPGTNETAAEAPAATETAPVASSAPSVPEDDATPVAPTVPAGFETVYSDPDHENARVILCLHGGAGEREVTLEKARQLMQQPGMSWRIKHTNVVANSHSENF